MDIVLPENARFDWDKANISHIALHHVIAEEAEEVFYQEPQIIAIDEKHSSEKETRYSMLGHTKSSRLLNIIFTFRGKDKEKIRVISARDQSRKERKQYDEEIRKGSEIHE